MNKLKENEVLLMFILIGFLFVNMLILVYNLYLCLIGKGVILNLGISSITTVGLFVIVWMSVRKFYGNNNKT